MDEYAVKLKRQLEYIGSLLYLKQCAYDRRLTSDFSSPGGMLWSEIETLKAVQHTLWLCYQKYGDVALSAREFGLETE